MCQCINVHNRMQNIRLNVKDGWQSQTTIWFCTGKSTTKFKLNIVQSTLTHRTHSFTVTRHYFFGSLFSHCWCLFCFCVFFFLDFSFAIWNYMIFHRNNWHRQSSNRHTYYTYNIATCISTIVGLFVLALTGERALERVLNKTMWCIIAPSITAFHDSLNYN